MSPNDFIKALAILGKYLKDGMDTKYFLGAEHDVIYFYVGIEELPEDSDDGKALVELGFHVEHGSWARFV